jgi:hypothetical protein
MMDRKSSRFMVVSIMALLLFSGISSACIGLVAGKVQLNVSVGYSGTTYFDIINNCDRIMNFTTAAKLYAQPNQTTPDIIISPRFGSMVPHQQAQINVTVYMPSNVMVGTSWSGGAAASEVMNSTVEGAANIGLAVLKIITVSSIAAPVNYFVYELIVVVIIILVAIAIALYYFLIVRKRRKQDNVKAVKKAPRAAAAKRKARKAKR